MIRDNKMIRIHIVHRGKSHKVGPAAKVGPARLPLFIMVRLICVLLVLSNMPEGTNEQYQNIIDAISRM